MSRSVEPESQVTQSKSFPKTTILPEQGVEVTGSVVVGIDGSSCAENALRWALHHVGTFGRVVPVTSFQIRSTFDPPRMSRRSSDPSPNRSAAEAGLTSALANVDPAVAERARVVEAHPGVGLVRAAADADLLIVGTRGRGGVTATLLGSVSAYCVSHATVPVIVIPPDAPPDEPLRTIAVGVDGSENADAALRWAIEHCAPDGTVVAVGAGSIFGDTGGVFDPTPATLERHISGLVEESVSRVIAPLGAGPEIVIVVDPGDARVVIPKIATDYGADMLVLGARGATGAPFLLLGSVSTALVHHPVMPTVIVPAGDNKESNR